MVIIILRHPYAMELLYCGRMASTIVLVNTHIASLKFRTFKLLSEQVRVISF